MDVDRIQHKLLSKCRFQIIAFVCLGLIYGRGAWNVFGILFLAADVSYRCDSRAEIHILESNSHHATYHSPDINSTLTKVSRTSDGKWRRLVVVKESGCDIVFSVDNGTNITKVCTSGWIYNSEFESTIVSEWDLVCARAYMSELSTTLFMVGSMIGTLLITSLADKFGRRLILLLCLQAQAVMGICVTLSPTYAVFAALRFIVGFFNMGISLSAYVMLTEIFPAKHRTVPCCGFQIFWAFGIMLTAFFGFMIRDWRHLQLILTLPNLLFAVFVWFMPESLPWLISQNQINKAQSVVERIARFNSIDLHKDICESDVSGSSCVHDSNAGDTTNHSGEQPLLRGTSFHQEAVLLLPGSFGSDESLKIATADKTICMGADEQNDLSCTEPQKLQKVAETDETKTFFHVKLQNDLSYTEPQKVVATDETETFFHVGRQNELSYKDICKSSSHLQVAVTAPVDKVVAQTLVSSDTVCTVTSGRTDNRAHSSTNNFSSILQLCGDSRMRLYSIIMFYLFFVNSLSYFGISLSTPALHGNQFLNLFLLGAVEVPAYVMCVFVCDRFGRKVPLSVFLLLCGVMNITAVLLPEEAHRNGLHVTLVMLGKFAITGGYTTVYLYAAEIFPTSVRNHAIGISSFFENLGSVAAPFIVFSARSVPELPMILFGVVSVIGGGLLIFMPETHRHPLPQTVGEVESWKLCR